LMVAVLRTAYNRQTGSLRAMVTVKALRLKSLRKRRF
jgi:hypothetical protein